MSAEARVAHLDAGVGREERQGVFDIEAFERFAVGGSPNGAAVLDCLGLRDADFIRRSRWCSMPPR
jgi:hypothetical protein